MARHNAVDGVCCHSIALPDHTSLHIMLYCREAIYLQKPPYYKLMLHNAHGPCADAHAQPCTVALSFDNCKEEGSMCIQSHVEQSIKQQAHVRLQVKVLLHQTS